MDLAVMRARAVRALGGLRLTNYRGHLELASAAVGTAGTLLILASLWWNVALVHRATIETANIQAGIAYEEDFLYRRWNSLHGGVYVKIGAGTITSAGPPGTPEREVVTTDGMRLSLVNFAGMARQAHEITGGAGQRVLARLTSLRPLRAGNSPDPWEREGLLAFERGATEFRALALLDGAEYVRLMKPVRNEAACLGCHRSPGEVVGGLRGAVNVAVPMNGLRAIERDNTQTLVLAHAALWLVGILGLLLERRLLLRVESARSAAETSLELRARELAESNRLKDLFADIMRHDLLNPAGVIGYYTDYILEGDMDPRTRASGLKIKHTVERLTQMIREASSFTQLRETGEIECHELDLGTVLAEALGDARADGRRGDVRLLFPTSGRFPVRANPMIGNVFSNLFANAAKYAGDGRVDVRIDDHHSCWTVSVADFGAGIADADKERIFCRFERLHKEGVRGSGLGLAIARHLVELHNGRIWVEDNPLGGAVFKVRLSKAGPGQRFPEPTASKPERPAITPQPADQLSADKQQSASR